MTFDVGAEVEVLDTIRAMWLPAVVVMRWRCARFEAEPNVLTTNQALKSFFEYDCDGEDVDGPFHGRWTEAYVRPRSRT